jgi:hypothetical protein
MPELARLAGGDLVTSPLLVASAWIGEPGFGGCEVPSRARTGAAALFGRLVTPLAAAVGQSGQRRSLAQHRPFGLRAVAGAASATSAAASSPSRKRAPRRPWGRPRPGTRNVALRARRPRDARWNKSDSRTPSASPSSVCPASLPRSRRCASLRPIAHRWPVLRNRGGRPAARGSRPPQAMVARPRWRSSENACHRSGSPGQRTSSSLKRRNAPRPLIATARRSARPGSSTDAMNSSMSR